MTVRGIHHPALVVGDLAAAIWFWTDVVGATVVQRVDEVGSAQATTITGLRHVSASIAVLRIGSSFVELIAFRSPRPRGISRRVCDLGWSHVCLEVDDIDREVDRFVDAGCAVVSTPVEMGDGLACYLDDPWANRFELWEISDETLRLTDIAAEGD